MSQTDERETKLTIVAIMISAVKGFARPFLSYGVFVAYFAFVVNQAAANTRWTDLLAVPLSLFALWLIAFRPLAVWRALKG